MEGEIGHYGSQPAPRRRIRQARGGSNVNNEEAATVRQNFRGNNRRRPFYNRPSYSRQSSKQSDGTQPDKSVTPDQLTRSPSTDEDTVPDFSPLDLNLRDKITKALQNRTYACLICISKVVPLEPIWSCEVCFHVYHLKCIKQWAFRCVTTGAAEESHTSALNENQWRCPSCQTKQKERHSEIKYRCFCRSRVNPDYTPGRGMIPHSCDQICRKIKNPPVKSAEGTKSSNKLMIECIHRCTMICHPGPCPPCVLDINESCPCGKMIRKARCGTEATTSCGKCCSQPLTTCITPKAHACPDICHLDPCPPCKKELVAQCYCGDQTKIVLCGSEEARFLDLSNGHKLSETNLVLELAYSCEKICNKTLECGEHSCQKPCHQGLCGRCKLRPQFCLMCPCGKVALSKLCSSGNINGNRKKCTDPIPVCPNECGLRNNVCGHPCKEKCHQGPCPPCPLTIHLTCQCEKSKTTLLCQDYSRMVDEKRQILCDRVCKKFKSCGRHTCKEKCCSAISHPCSNVCGKKLTCGSHNCEESCHSGPCGTCWRGVIYDSIACHCGLTVLEPPQPCGTQPPDCEHPCQRSHFCFHEVRHKCHREQQCPPCTVLMSKPCPGGHTMLFNIPCFKDTMTCGQICDKPLGPDCEHRCKRGCHSGPCVSKGPEASNESAKCTEPCIHKRPECGHDCALPCHPGQKCQDLYEKREKPEFSNDFDVAVTSMNNEPLFGSCHALVPLECACGTRMVKRKCYRVQNDPAIFVKECERLTCEKLGEVRDEFDENLPLYLKRSGNKLLDCDASCKAAVKAKEQAARREKIANSLWVRGADAESVVLPAPFDPPEYSDFLRKFAAHNITFAKSVEDQLHEAVIASREAQNGRYFYNFAPMKAPKRRFVHELAEHYAIECHVCDPNPARYVMIIATANISKFPGSSPSPATRLTTVVENEFKPMQQAVYTKRPIAKVATNQNISANKQLAQTSSVTTAISYANMVARDD